MEISRKLSRYLYRLILSLLLYFPTQSVAQYDTLRLDSMHQLIAGGYYPNIHAVLVQQSADLRYEAYFGGYTADSLHDVRSAFKSVTSLLTGIALDKGFLAGVDIPLLQFFPDFQPKDQRKKDITLRHLLEMKAGFRIDEFYGIGPEVENKMWETDDWIDYSLKVPMKDDPGLNFAYSSCQPLLVGAALSHAAKETIMSFSKEHLFDPLGITDYRWTITPGGYGMTAGSFFMKPSDMLKLGELVLREGNWQGQTIISDPWIATSTRCSTPIDYSFVRYSRMDNAKNQSARYGYYWYKERLRYKDIDTVVLFASGNGGQYIMILPDWDMVAVFTGGNYGNWRGKLPFELLLKYILPSFEKPGNK